MYYIINLLNNEYKEKDKIFEFIPQLVAGVTENLQFVIDKKPIFKSYPIYHRANTQS